MNTTPNKLNPKRYYIFLEAPYKVKLPFNYKPI